MNYLAHAYLSDTDEDCLIGNFIADTVKGRFGRFNPGVQRGIRLHHAIDEYCDANVHFRRSVSRIEGRQGLYAPVIVDIYYDHFLASGWNDYHYLPLPHFTATVYRILLSRFDELPFRMKRMLPYMISSNWLVAYGEVHNLRRFFTGLSSRASSAPLMKDAVTDLKLHYKELGEDFTLFMKDIRPYIHEILKTI